MYFTYNTIKEAENNLTYDMLDFSRTLDKANQKWIYAENELVINNIVYKLIGKDNSWQNYVQLKFNTEHFKNYDYSIHKDVYHLRYEDRPKMPVTYFSIMIRKSSKVLQNYYK